MTYIIIYHLSKFSPRLREWNKREHKHEKHFSKYDRMDNGRQVHFFSQPSTGVDRHKAEKSRFKMTDPHK